MRTFLPFLLMFSINTKRAKTRENLRSHHKHDHHRSSTNRQNNHVVDAFGCQRRQLTTPLVRVRVRVTKKHIVVSPTPSGTKRKSFKVRTLLVFQLLSHEDAKYSPNPNPPFLDHATANSLGIEHSHPNKYPHAPIVWTI
jgi:hypothetical protein